MKTFFLILLSVVTGSYYFTKDAVATKYPMNVSKKYTYLALGDSYTIGEKVPAIDNFPNQTVSLLQKDGVTITLAKIIATTGWTTDELEKAIATEQHNGAILPAYDFVSLLIGVNNQYRGRSLENYRAEFEELLKKAIRFAGNHTSHVVVISIPDWGITPFAKDRNQQAIANEIDAYNAANKEIATRYQVSYIDITSWTREATRDPSLLAPDGLHPSAKEYHRWAIKIAEWMKNGL
jgi:lysophospholipase L1-like esterase